MLHRSQRGGFRGCPQVFDGVRETVGEEEWLVAIALLSWHYAIVGYGLVWSMSTAALGTREHA
jgi:hypothetical protein